MPKPLCEYPDLMTIDEACEYLRCCDKTVRTMVRAGKLQVYRVGSSIRIIKKSLRDVAFN